MATFKHLYAVIMAGGRGERFWPAGRRMMPKQLLNLSSEHTMLEDAFLRLLPVMPPENILIVTNCDFEEQIRELLPVPPENVIGEPAGRDTTGCIALGCALIQRRDPEAIMAVLPSDHIIRPTKRFQNALEQAADEAQSTDSLLTFGITPSHPSTAYGYIKLGTSLAPGVFAAESFAEKPDEATAKKFFMDGNYKWNSGIFVWRCDVIRRQFQNHCPEFERFIADFLICDDEKKFLSERFPALPRIAVDRAVLEKTNCIKVVEAPFYWNDLGSWFALKSISESDKNGNTLKGRVAALDTNNSILWSDEEHMLGVIGMDNVAVIKSGNGILVCPLDQTQKIKELVKHLPPDFA